MIDYLFPTTVYQADLDTPDDVHVGMVNYIDKRLYKEDIKGSIAHVEMLFKQKIISFKIKNKIIYGLNKIERECIESTC